jgi:catechol 2,3-dioxygenase-like lactoylglutathione lyase family enzyme
MDRPSNNPMTASALTTILVVANLPVAKKFYTEILGASLFREYGGTSIVLEFLGNWILLVSPGGPTEDKPEVHFVAPQDKNAISSSFTIRVDDCQQAYDFLKQGGARFITPPVKKGAETRCFFYDPDGHLFEISQYD